MGTSARAVLQEESVLLLHLNLVLAHGVLGVHPILVGQVLLFEADMLLRKSPETGRGLLFPQRAG